MRDVSSKNLSTILTLAFTASSILLSSCNDDIRTKFGGTQLSSTRSIEDASNTGQRSRLEPVKIDPWVFTVGEESSYQLASWVPGGGNNVTFTGLPSSATTKTSYLADGTTITTITWKPTPGALVVKSKTNGGKKGMPVPQDKFLVTAHMSPVNDESYFRDVRIIFQVIDQDLDLKVKISPQEVWITEEDNLEQLITITDRLANLQAGISIELKVSDPQGDIPISLPVSVNNPYTITKQSLDGTTAVFSWVPPLGTVQGDIPEFNTCGTDSEGKGITKCRKKSYKLVFIAHDGGPYPIVSEPFIVNVRQKRLSPEITTPQVIDSKKGLVQAQRIDFTVYAKDGNSFEPPLLMASDLPQGENSAPQVTTSTFGKDITIIHYSWDDVPPSLFDKTLKFPVKVCTPVHQGSSFDRRCSEDSVMVTVTKGKIDQIPGIEVHRDEWPATQIRYLAAGETGLFNLKIKDLSSDDSTSLLIDRVSFPAGDNLVFDPANVYSGNFSVTVNKPLAPHATQELRMYQLRVRSKNTQQDRTLKFCAKIVAEKPKVDYEDLPVGTTCGGPGSGFESLTTGVKPQTSRTSLDDFDPTPQLDNQERHDQECLPNLDPKADHGGCNPVPAPEPASVDPAPTSPTPATDLDPADRPIEFRFPLPKTWPKPKLHEEPKERREWDFHPTMTIKTVSSPPSVPVSKSRTEILHSEQQ